MRTFLILWLGQFALGDAVAGLSTVALLALFLTDQAQKYGSCD